MANWAQDAPVLIPPGTSLRHGILCPTKLHPTGHGWCLKPSALGLWWHFVCHSVINYQWLKTSSLWWISKISVKIWTCLIFIGSPLWWKLLWSNPRWKVFCGVQNPSKQFVLMLGKTAVWGDNKLNVEWVTLRKINSKGRYFRDSLFGVPTIGRMIYDLIPHAFRMYRTLLLR